MAKPVTVNELKTFIDAVEFASDSESWVPSERQWKRIREMINSLEEAAAPPPPPPVTYAPSAPLAPPQQQFVPQGFQPPMNPSMPTWTPPPNVPLAGPFASGSANPVKTPDIDTGHGKPYQSLFAS